jgi:hypothetical protein
MLRYLTPPAASHRPSLAEAPRQAVCFLPGRLKTGIPDFRLAARIVGRLLVSGCRWRRGVHSKETQKRLETHPTTPFIFFPICELPDTTCPRNPWSWGRSLPPATPVCRRRSVGFKFDEKLLYVLMVLGSHGKCFAQRSEEYLAHLLANWKSRNVLCGGFLFWRKHHKTYCPHYRITRSRNEAEQFERTGARARQARNRKRGTTGIRSGCRLSTDTVGFLVR